ncbi:MAG: tyrosine-type recombinase/integrase, partial [Caldilineaceae bacterium]|nr:tyrosine-type recombinase/integrase [Caldilineaceae bacterium]
MQPGTMTVNKGDYTGISTSANDEQLVALWLATGKRANSPATRDAYMRAWCQFREYIGKGLQWVKVDDLIAWVEAMPGAPATVRARIGAIKSLFAFALKVGYTRANPALLIEAPQAPDTSHRRIVSMGGIELLLKACKTPRETALVWCLYGSGARISEVLALRWQDITPRTTGGAVLHILSGKGRKSRKAGIGPKAYAAMLALRTATTQGNDFVFITTSGKPVDRQSANKTMKRLAKRAGLDEDISAHWLRHSHASHYIQKGGNVADLQKQLGHASLQTTSRYAHAESYTGDLL